MKVIGVTGNIACGKSTVARQFGQPVFDADQTVHQLLAAHPHVIKAISQRYPQAVQGGVVKRPVLAGVLYNSRAAKWWLERLLHPYVILASLHFIAQHRRAGRRLVVLDVPLLFESGMHWLCNITVLADSHPYQQRKRLNQRGIKPARQQAIIRQQTCPARLARQVTHVVNSSRPLGLRQGKGLLGKLYEF